MRVIAFDSKKIQRKQPNFKALLGVGITLSDYKKFCNEYNKIIEKIFQDYGFTRNKIIYKGSDLLSIFLGAGVDIIPKVVENMDPYIDFIDVYYSYFEPSDRNKPYSMGVYWEEELVRLSAPKFIDLMEGPFPAICCHAHIKLLNTQVASTFFIDHCPGLRPSTAINSVINNNSTRFLFKGDQVNPAISIADILCRYIDQECLSKGYYLNKDIIEKIGFDPKKSRTTFIGPSWLRDIKPSRDVILEINHKYPHPIFFFFPDNTGPFANNSRDVLEKSRLFSLALDRAAELGGSIKFFDSSDQNFITKEDFLVLHNELSEKKIDELSRLACPAKKINATFFER